ncbi:MFS transporter [Streptomyces sp. NPDC050738]|uniref:MFS transporter n=1 Tax=Streptomyces sp. NPDC050738 TaxID=3154744 RepID=UPI00342FAFAD
MSAAQLKIAMGLCLATILLAVLDMNIVSAATVPISQDLDPAHGIEKIPWLISAFALASAAALPLYGKLCDTLGAKKVFIGAIATFLFGSALCGAAQSMDQLIAARALQGIGGGGLMSITMVVIAQLKGPGEKSGPKSGGGIGGIVAGAGMAIGPSIGGFLSEHANWRWIFYVNLPIGIAVLIAAVLVLKLPAGPVRHRIDFAGAGLAAAFAVCLLLVTEWGGKTYAWSSPQILALTVGCFGTLALFLRRQATAAEPILPLTLFKVPELRYGFAIQGLVGASMMGAIVYVMIYLQTVRSVASTSAGLYLIPLAIGMSLVGILAGRLSDRGVTTRSTVICGTLIATATFALLATTGTDTSLWAIRGELFLMGAGFGLLIGQLIQYVQGAAPAHQLGVATTAIRFFQTLGNAIGAAVFGTVLARLYEAHGPGSSAGAIATLTGAAHTRALGALTDSIGVVFWCASGLMAVAAVLALRLPRTAAEQAGADGAGLPAQPATSRVAA